MNAQIPGVKTERKGSANKASKGNVFDSSGAMRRRIRKFMQLHDVKSYMHLSRLLGVRSGSTVWAWMNTARRPNARFTSRMLELTMWVQEHGLDLTSVEYVDWDIPMIVLRGGAGESRRYLSPRDWAYISDNSVEEGHGPVRLRP